MFGRVGHALRTFSLLQGLPVYELKSGEKLGEVCDIGITNNGKVNGLFVKNGALFKKAQKIKLKHIASLGQDGVMVQDRQLLEPVDETDNYTFHHHQRLHGKEMLTSEGHRLGFLEDVYFLEEVGTIVGYELTDGFFSDVMEGKRVVKPVHPPAIGKDTMIVNIEE